MKVQIPLPTSIYKSVDEAGLPDHIGSRLIDGYINEFGHIVKRPGLSATVFCNLGVTSKIDGLYWWERKGVIIAVSSGRIYKITASDGTFTDVTGTDTLQSSGRVSFAPGWDGAGNEILVMANGGKMLTYTGTGSPAYMADADAPITVSFVAFLDQYTIALKGGTGIFQWSGVANALAWAAIDLATAESKPDDLVAIATAYQELILVGKETIEFWITDAAIGFTAVKSATIEIGCIASASFVNCGGAFLWLDNYRRVVRMDGRSVTPLSSPFDDEIRDIASVADARGLYINIGVRRFYVLNFPTAGISYAYDLSTGQWAEWSSWSTVTGAYTTFKCNEYAYAKSWNFHLLGDSSTGKIYKMDPTSHTDGGSTIRTLVRTGQLSHGSLNRKRSNVLWLRLKRGVGSVSTAPKMQIRWKNDGASWGNWHEVSLGVAGDSYMIGRINRLGQYRTRQYEVVHSADSAFQLVGMEEDLEVLRN